MTVVFLSANSRMWNAIIRLFTVFGVWFVGGVSRRLGLLQTPNDGVWLLVRLAAV